MGLVVLCHILLCLISMILLGSIGHSYQCLFSCQSAVGFGGGLEGFFCGIAFVVGAIGDNALGRGMTVLDVDKGKA